MSAQQIRESWKQEKAEGRGQTSKNGKTYTALDGTTVLTYDGVKAKEAAEAKEAAKGNPRFIEGSPALKWKSERFGCHFPPMFDKTAIDREANIRTRPEISSKWVK